MNNEQLNRNAQEPNSEESSAEQRDAGAAVQSYFAVSQFSLGVPFSPAPSELSFWSIGI
jgi:hypothetical protein